MLSLPALAVAATMAAGQAADQKQASPATPLTVKAINSPTEGTPPRNPVWSPDGRLLTFVVAENSRGLAVGKPGDIVQVEVATGKMSVLVTAAQRNALGTKEVNEKDRDHRERYGMASYLWSGNSRHLLLDKGGMLWLWDLSKATGSLLIDTHAGSGDDPKFSPDGKSVSYLRDHNLYVHPVSAVGGGEVALSSTPAGAEAGAVLNGEVDWVYLEELDVRTNYAWSPDSKAIAYLQMDERKVPQYPIEDFLPTHATVDWQRYPQPGDPNPGVKVGVAAATGGATTWIDVRISTGNDYIPRFGWVDRDTVWVEVLRRDQKRMDVYLADRRTGASHLLYTETDPKYLDTNYDVDFLPHGQFLRKSWSSGHTHLYLYAFDAEHPLGAEAKLVRQLTEGDFEVQSVSVPEGPDRADWIYFTSTEGSPLETNLWVEKLDGSGKRRLTAGNGSHEVNVSPDGRSFTDQASALLTPPTLRLCPTQAGGPCSPLWQSAAVAEAAGTGTRIVTLKAADRVTTLYGVLTAPSSGGRHTVPLILNPYGGPTPTAGAADRWHGAALRFNQLLAQHGFAVLTVDNRGSGGRGRDFQQADYRNFGPVQFADQIAALDQTLAANEQLDPDRVGWWGWSWGGNFTLYAMTHTDRIRAGVAVAPGNTDQRNYDSVYVERYLGQPAAEPDVYRAANTDDVAAKLKGRVLIAQGTGDDNVHMVNAMQFVQALITAEIPYDLQMFPRLTHSLAGTHARNELYDRILYQFETYLKPPVSASQK